jgi:hypothetical protein
VMLYYNQRASRWLCQCIVASGTYSGRHNY